MSHRRPLVLAAPAVPAAIGLTGIAAAAAPTNSRSSGTEHFIVLRTSLKSDPTIIARGPVHARGKDVIVSGRLERFVFPDGVVIVRHHPTEHRDRFDPVTCYGRHTESGPYTIVGGTKAYANVAGHGTYHLRVQAVGCSQSKPPRPFLLQAGLRGPIHL